MMLNKTLIYNQGRDGIDSENILFVELEDLFNHIIMNSELSIEKPDAKYPKIYIGNSLAYVGEYVTKSVISVMPKEILYNSNQQHNLSTDNNSTTKITSYFRACYNFDIGCFLKCQSETQM